ncbi:MAG: B12-binding domain-containing radical SAM protein, partial [Kiritimatiellae bacterium]|nr:B12-binding domain-containing radical SAM protein [Kiritimatiellia bacterium]
MRRARLKKWLLVNYAGYPYAANSLFPDNGLANLAGALLEEGAEVQIADYATVAVLSEMTPPRLRRHLAKVFEKIVHSPPEKPASGLLERICGLATLQMATLWRSQRQRRLVARIGEELARRVKRESIQAVGFKLWSGDGMFGSVALAGAVKKACPGVRIFGGGPQVDIFMDRILSRFPVFSALVYGEGEETIRLLAQEGGEESAYPGIPNLLFRKDGRIQQTEDRFIQDLDRLPWPAYESEIYPAMAGNEKIRILVLDESRGCGNNCAFCLHPVKSHRQLRTKGVKRLVAEVVRARERFKVKTFRLAGSSTPYGLLNDFASEVLRSGIELLYSSFAHVRGAVKADFSAIRRSGCTALFFGIESGSQRVLDAMRKGIKVAEIAAAIRGAHEAGIAA